MSVGFKPLGRAGYLCLSLMTLFAYGNDLAAEGPIGGRAQGVPGSPILIAAAVRPSREGPGADDRADSRRDAASAADPSSAAPAEQEIDSLGIATPPTLTFRGHTEGVWALSYSGDGQWLATAGFDGTARVWEAGTGRESLKITLPGGALYGVAFHPDPSRIAVAGEDGTARVYDVGTGRETLTLEVPDTPLFGIAYSPDGRRLAAAGDGSVRLWDAVSGASLLRIEGHSGRVYGIAVSPDG
jgi:WD40 repeat protein